MIYSGQIMHSQNDRPPQNPKNEGQHRNKIESIGNLTPEQIYKDIVSSLDALKIDQTKFKNPVDLLVTKLIRFLTEYKVNYLYFNDYERTIISLSLVDLWITTLNSKDQNKIKRLKQIVNEFRLICVDSDNTQNLSLKVKNAKHGSSLKLFDPESKNTDVPNITNPISKIFLEIQSNYIDHSRSEYVNSQLVDIVPKIVEVVKDSLYDDFETAKKHFEVKILTLSKYELQELSIMNGMSLGWSAFCYQFDDLRSLIYLPYDSPSLVTDMFHEITHAISRGYNHGYMFIAGRGFDEAFTERNNIKSLAYPYPRYILEIILKNHPDLESIFKEVYFGQKNRNVLYTEIFNIYGSEGLLMFDFMMSTKAENKGKLESMIQYNFQECLSFFEYDKPDEYRLATTQITKIHTMAKNSVLESIKNKADQTKIIQPLFQIERNINNIEVCVSEMPLKYLFEDDKLFKEFKLFLDDLKQFEVSLDLIELSQKSNYWHEILTQKYTNYYIQNANKPLFERNPGLKTSSKLTPKELEIAWLRSESMQGRPVLKNN